MIRFVQQSLYALLGLLAIAILWLQPDAQLDPLIKSILTLWLTPFCIVGIHRSWHRYQRRCRRDLLFSGRCPRCGYDLRATPFRCPECGFGHCPTGNAPPPRPPSTASSALPHHRPPPSTPP